MNFLNINIHSAYGWILPETEDLLNNRKFSSYPMVGSKSDDTLTAPIMFACNESKSIEPLKVKKASYKLGPHRSIVNSVVSHPHLPILVTAGVEKVVRLWSSFFIGDDLKKLDISSDMMEDDEVISHFDDLVINY